jgi:hypothetical protein
MAAALYVPCTRLAVKLNRPGATRCGRSMIGGAQLWRQSRVDPCRDTRGARRHRPCRSYSHLADRYLAE